MALASWWQERDNLPLLSPITTFRGEICRDAALLAWLSALEATEINRRLAAGHQAYVGYLEEQPVAYGWVARQSAEIGELGIEFKLPIADRYLWDFQTLPAWRGRGVYPRLLQAIIRGERREGGQRFWIISAPENGASASGIAKAGFEPVGEILFLAPNQAFLLPTTSSQMETKKAVSGAALLGLKILEVANAAVAECWHCVITSPQGCQCQLTYQNEGGEEQAMCSCVHPVPA